MLFTGSPDVVVKKNDIPMIYLDTFIMIELAKYSYGNCTDPHKEEIGEIFALLTQLLNAKKILCPLGNQLKEMGMSHGRKSSKNFLLNLTNITLKLPFQIKEDELEIGYRAFIAESTFIDLPCSTVIDPTGDSDTRFKIHVSPVYSKGTVEKLRDSKLNTTNILNDIKKRKLVEADFESQLWCELQADYQLLCNAFAQHNFPSGNLNLLPDELWAFYKRTGTSYQSGIPLGIFEQYIHFLLSSYHHNLPYQRIEAVLWAHLMQRSNTIKNGDRLDIMWASSYLPFIDYAITDNAFCALLNDSGLSDHYDVKVFSATSFRNIINELKQLINQ